MVIAVLASTPAYIKGCVWVSNDRGAILSTTLLHEKLHRDLRIGAVDCTRRQTAAVLGDDTIVERIAPPSEYRDHVFYCDQGIRLVSKLRMTQ